MMKILTAFTVCLLLFAATSAQSQAFNRARMDSFFDQLAARKLALGNIAISKNGQLLYSRAIGFTHISGTDTIAATTATRYRIGSITKTFTATMILQLVEEGKLKLTDYLTDYFPRIPNAGKITIQQMLSHRSGIHNFTNDSLYSTYYQQGKTQAEMVKIMTANQPDFTPGERAAYSNANFLLLGYLVEKLDKRTYAQSLKKRITDKAKLAHTTMGAKINMADQESQSFLFKEDWQLSPETDPSIPGGAGAIVSTATDLVKFYEALFDLQLINAGSLETMKTIKDGFGLGLLQIPFYDRKAFAHNGNIDGFSSSVGHFPSDSMTFAYCSNGYAYPFNDVLMGVLSIYFNTPNYNLPTFDSVTVPINLLEQYLGVYATTEIPLKLAITRTGQRLYGQATGQPSFPLEAVTENTFRFVQAGLQIAFDSAANTLTLTQGGRNIRFTKE